MKKGYTALNTRDGDAGLPYQWKDTRSTGDVELTNPQHA